MTPWHYDVITIMLFSGNPTTLLSVRLLPIQHGTILRYRATGAGWQDKGGASEREPQSRRPARPAGYGRCQRSTQTASPDSKPHSGPHTQQGKTVCGFAVKVLNSRSFQAKVEQLAQKHQQPQNENHQILKESIEIKTQMGGGYNMYPRPHQPQPVQPHAQREEDVRRFYMYSDQRRKEQQVTLVFSSTVKCNRIIVIL